MLILKHSRYVLILFLLFCAQCGSTGKDNTNIRVLNLVPDSFGLNIQLEEFSIVSDEDRLSFFDIRYTEVSQYGSLDEGLVEIEVRNDLNGEKFLEDSFTFDDDDFYTVIIADDLDSADFIIAEDTRDIPGSDSARVRFIHGSASATTVDIYITASGAPLPSQPTFRNVDFRDITRYSTFAAGEYQVRFTTAASSLVLADSGAITLSGREVTTAIIIDTIGVGGPNSVLFIDG